MQFHIIKALGCACHLGMRDVATAGGCPQVKLDDTSACLDSLFLFSLIWSLGATCDRPSSVKFDAFLRQLVAGKVTAAAERSDFDLGPGLTISYPEQLLSTQLPQVSAGRATSCARLGRVVALVIPAPLHAAASAALCVEQCMLQQRIALISLQLPPDCVLHL